MIKHFLCDYAGRKNNMCGMGNNILIKLLL